MKKDHLRDYATHAFRTYAAAGCPTYDQLRQKLIDDIAAQSAEPIAVKGGISKPTEAAVIAAERAIEARAGELSDLIAVIQTIDQIGRRRDGKQILRCLELVYFVEPTKELEPGDISARVIKASMEIPMSERSVYYSLKEARKIFSEERGLNLCSKVGI